MAGYYNRKLMRFCRRILAGCERNVDVCVRRSKTRTAPSVNSNKSHVMANWQNPGKGNVLFRLITYISRVDTCVCARTRKRVNAFLALFILSRVFVV